jgi:Peptidase family S41.
LRKTQNLIIDVRGNKHGSFRFIESWLREYTRSHWKNVIIRERQTIQILNGLLNRVQWNMHHYSSSHLKSNDQLEQKREQIRGLIEYLIEKGLDQRLVETKFIFNGNKDAPEWGTRLIIIANHNCGNGCQFLAALTKQIPYGTLIGTNTGSFPKNSFRPVFQLRHSRIMLTFGNKLHLNHIGEPVSTSGYLPDYWLFPPMRLTEIIRYAKKP